MGRSLLIVFVAALSSLVGFSASVWTSYQSSVENDRQPSLIGVRPPPFALTDTDGTLHSLAQWDGEVLLLNFWASWCPPCIREMPDLVALQTSMGPSGLQIIGLTDDPLNTTISFLSSRPVNYPILQDTELTGRIAQTLGNHDGVLPYSVLINRSGEIVSLHRGLLNISQLRTEILALL